MKRITLIILSAFLLVAFMPITSYCLFERNYNELLEEASRLDHSAQEGAEGSKISKNAEEEYFILVEQRGMLDLKNTKNLIIEKVDGRAVTDSYFQRHGLIDENPKGLKREDPKYLQKLGQIYLFPGRHTLEVSFRKEGLTHTPQFLKEVMFSDKPIVIEFYVSQNKEYDLGYLEKSLQEGKKAQKRYAWVPVVTEKATGHTVSSVYGLRLPSGPLGYSQVASISSQKLLEHLWKRSNKGEVLSQYFLAAIQMNGQGFGGNYVDVAEAYQEPGYEPNGQSLFSLGIMYYNGFGTGRNYAKALQWFEKAAEEGNAPAADFAGWMHENGLGVQRNYKKALQWYRLGLLNGSHFAQDKIDNIKKEWGEVKAVRSEK